MIAVRYVALVMLVLWIGAAIDFLFGLTPDEAGRYHAIAYASGVVIIICFVAIKLMGPPPRAFAARTATVAAMLALTAYGDVLHRDSALLVGVDAGLGLALLSWYVRE